MQEFHKKIFKRVRGGVAEQSKPAAPSEADPARQYMEEVCSQIRYKRAWPYIEKELEDHIEDQKRNLVKAGIHEAEALRRAVLEMGDAVTVGQELDRVHRPKPEWSIIVIMGVMLCIGAFVQYYLSAIAAEGGWMGKMAFYKYMTALPAGIAVLLVIYFADYTVLGKYPKRIYAGTLLLCVGLYLYDGQLVSFYGHNLDTRYQMVYLALLLLPAFGAVLYGYRNSGYGGILKCGAAAVLAILVLGYSQLEYVPAIFALGGLILLSAAIAKGWFAVEKKKAFALVYVPTLLCIFGFFLIKLWRYGDQRDVFLERIRDKFMIIHSEGFHIVFARSIVKNAQFIGQGELGPMVKSGSARLEEILPIWWGDFSLTYLIHQWGLAAGILVLAIFTFLMIKMIRAALKQKNALGFMISLSAVTAVGMQCALFFSANLGVGLLVILPLPLMTMGQTSFIVNMAFMGLLLSAYRNIDIVREIGVEHQGTDKKENRSKRKIGI